jgi:molecular chaperone GrpE
MSGVRAVSQAGTFAGTISTAPGLKYFAIHHSDRNHSRGRPRFSRFLLPKGSGRRWHEGSYKTWAGSIGLAEENVMTIETSYDPGHPMVKRRLRKRKTARWTIGTRIPHSGFRGLQEGETFEKEAAMYKNGIPAEFLTRHESAISARHGMKDIDTQKQKDLAALEQELAVQRDRYLRLAADFDNYRKRTAREMDRRAGRQKDALVSDLLPAIDNLERAVAAKAGEELRAGLKMVHEQLVAGLGRHGFEPRNDLGQPFDGRFHDGIAVGQRPEMPNLSVLEVWERGWMRGSEIFRPAKVLVNQLCAPSSQEAEDPDGSATDPISSNQAEYLAMETSSR